MASRAPRSRGNVDVGHYSDSSAQHSHTNPWSDSPHFSQTLMPNNAHQTICVSDDDLLLDRDRSIADIQREMQDLQHVWLEVAGLVDMQAENVQTIETAIQDSLHDVQKAKDDVAEANRSQIESRKGTAVAVGAGAGIGAIIIGILTLKFLH